MRLQMMLTVLALTCAAPAGAVPESPGREAAQPTGAVADIERQMTGYGEWLVRLNEIQAPVQEQLIALNGRWQAAGASRDFNASSADLRAGLVEMEAAIDQADAALAALPTPEFPALDLDATLRPAEIVGEVRRYMAQLRTVVAGFSPLLDAVRTNNPRALDRAMDQLMVNARLLVRSQVLMARAAQAATRRGESAWNALEVQVLFFQAAERIAAAWPGLEGRRDAQLPADLIRLAGALERSAEAGTALADTEIRTMREDLAAAEEAADRDLISIARRGVATLEVMREVFPLGRDLAGVLRSHAPRFRGGEVPIQTLVALLRAVQPLRLRLDDLVAREGAALAGQ